MKDLSLEQVGVDEKLGRRIPTDISFRDQTGKSVQLSRFFTGVPVIFTLNYYACPTLCPLYFMHLRHEIKLVLGFALFPLLILALIIIGTLTDTLFR